MKKKNKVDDQKIADFFKETEKKTETPPSETGENPSKSPSLPEYLCPQCHKAITSRKEPCPHCGYHGYIPMSESETGRIRLVLFIVLLGVAIAVYLLTRGT